MIAQLGHLVRISEATIFALAALRVAFGLYRFTRLPRAAKRNYPAALWARCRWRWLTRNLNLAYLDQHRRVSKRPSIPFGTSVRVKAPVPGGPARLRFPRAKFTADSFGVIARVRTVPGVGVTEFSDNADYIADAWRCVRVQVSQPKPGRVIVRGLRTDPLTLPLSLSNPITKTAPSAVIRANGSVVSSDGTPARLSLGRDEWGADRYLPLRGVTGITVGGLPGYGKTSLINHWLSELAGSAAVQFVIIDGKGAGEYDHWAARSWIHVGDDLADAAAALEDVHALMRSRFADKRLAAPHNVFAPLVVTVIDEAHTFFDLEAVKGDRRSEQLVRTCRALVGQLVRKGRVANMLTIVLTQKQTGDAIPTFIRDNCGCSLCFAVKTKEAAVASLGDAIRDYPSQCPTGLQDPAYVGVATASLRTGLDPFVRVRVPEVSEAAAAARARATVPLRRDPAKPPVCLLKPSSRVLASA